MEPENHTTSSLAFEKWQPTKFAVQLLLSIFSVSYVFLCLGEMLPDSDAKKHFIEPFEQFLYFWRLDQNWRLFSPKIRDNNFHVVTIVAFQDGSRMLYEPPRMARYGFWQRFLKEKYRKMDVDMLPWDDFYKEEWPDFARWVARRFYSAKNPPVALTAYNVTTDIPPPIQGLAVDRSHMPNHSKIYFLFYVRFKPQDFQ